MSRVSTYLTFTRSCEAAFLFYKAVFGTEFLAPLSRFRDIPPAPDQPPIPESERDLVLHVSLPLFEGFVLMGSDAPESMCSPVNQGNNVHINLEPDTRAETERLFAALSAGGTVEMPLADMFWGAYFGSFVDRFGTRWMLNCATKA